MKKIFIVMIVVINQWILFFANIVQYKVNVESETVRTSMIEKANSMIVNEINTNHPAFFNEDINNNFTNSTKISEYAFKELKVVLESIGKSSYYKKMKFRGYLPKLDQKKVEIYIAFDDNETQTIEFHYYNATRKKITDTVAQKVKKISINENSKKEEWKSRLYVENKADKFKKMYISNHLGKSISVGSETIYLSLARMKFNDWKVNSTVSEKTNVDVYYKYFPTENKFKLQVNLKEKKKKKKKKKKDKDKDKNKDDKDKNDNEGNDNENNENEGNENGNSDSGESSANEFPNAFKDIAGGLADAAGWLAGALIGIGSAIKGVFDEIGDFFKNLFGGQSEPQTVKFVLKTLCDEDEDDEDDEDFLAIFDAMPKDEVALEKWLSELQKQVDIIGPYEREVDIIFELPNLPAQKITINFNDKLPNENSINQLKNYLTNLFNDLVIVEDSIKKTDGTINEQSVKKILDLNIDNKVLWNNEMVPFNSKKYLQISHTEIKDDVLHLSLKYEWIAEPINLKINLI